MRNDQSIIEDYKLSDDTRRLCLFLECPDLREAFMEIEMGQQPGRYEPELFFDSKPIRTACLSLGLCSGILAMCFCAAWIF